jgi:hypothetical protein
MGGFLVCGLVFGRDQIQSPSLWKVTTLTDGYRA